VIWVIKYKKSSGGVFDALRCRIEIV